MPDDQDQNEILSVPSWKTSTHLVNTENDQFTKKPKSVEILSKLVKYLILFLIMGAVAVVGLNIYQLFAPKQSVIKTLYIEGDERCIERVNQALILLKNEADKYYQKIEKNVNSIRCEKGGLLNNSGGKYTNDNLKKFIIYDRVYNHPEINWVAATIVHETCHAEQFQTFDADKDKYSKEQLESQKARNLEGECDTEVVNVLTELGANQYDIDYVKSNHR